jgi:enamine deaminase RidA (YjgF/YER057c/UK114 family)
MATVHPVPELPVFPGTHYSQVVSAAPGRLVWIAGQVGWNKEGIVAPDLEEQTRQTFRNLEFCLRAAGCSMSNVVDLTVYVLEPSAVGVTHKVRKEFFSVDPPASTSLVVAALARPDLLVEVQAFAVVEAPRQ